MVPDFRRDDAWTPAFAGVTENRGFFRILLGILYPVQRMILPLCAMLYALRVLS